MAAEIVKPGVTDLLMCHNVRVAVSTATGGDQVPWTLDGIRRSQRVMFGRRPTSTPTPADQAAAAWEKVKDTKDPKRLRVFAKQNAGTVYAQVAMLTADKLLASPAAKRRKDGLGGGSTTKTLKSGMTFKDCEACPEMTVVPSGNFKMGAITGQWDQRPVRKVSISKPFAVGKFEVTFAEWDACITDGGCTHRPSDKGWGRGRRPVIQVSWNDIVQHYLPWLSQKAGKPYRLLTEADWEYAARAETTTGFWWGEKGSHEYANYGKDGCCGGLAKGADKWVNTTAPVGPFSANPFGLHDLNGNVGEWVQDCALFNYIGAPTDGSAVAREGCTRHSGRGGSWYSNSKGIGTAFRGWGKPNNRTHLHGFRVARDLTR